MVLVSDKNMDDLLAQLKAEFEPEPQALPKVSKPPASKSKLPPQGSPSQVPIAQMLEELRKELESGRNRPDSASQGATEPNSKPQLSPQGAAKARQRLNALIDADYQKQAQKREAKLAEIKRQAEARLAEEKRRQQELIEMQQRAELREQRRQEALREDAKQWLEKLDPRTEEGKWFQEFSYSYENKLQAAIDYLSALRETGL